MASDLAGCFVVEAGERQAWPFVGFCDNRRSSPLRETRLYLDCEWHVSPSSASGSNPLLGLLELNNLTVAAAFTDDRTPSLVIEFEGGASLTVSGEATASTTGEPWWLSTWM